MLEIQGIYNNKAWNGIPKFRQTIMRRNSQKVDQIQYFNNSISHNLMDGWKIQLTVTKTAFILIFIVIKKAQQIVIIITLCGPLFLAHVVNIGLHYRGNILKIFKYI